MTNQIPPSNQNQPPSNWPTIVIDDDAEPMEMETGAPDGVPIAAPSPIPGYSHSSMTPMEEWPGINYFYQQKASVPVSDTAPRPVEETTKELTTQQEREVNAQLKALLQVFGKDVDFENPRIPLNTLLQLHKPSVKPSSMFASLNGEEPFILSSVQQFTEREKLVLLAFILIPSDGLLLKEQLFLYLKYCHQKKPNLPSFTLTFPTTRLTITHNILSLAWAFGLPLTLLSADVDQKTVSSYTSGHQNSIIKQITDLLLSDFEKETSSSSKRFDFVIPHPIIAFPHFANCPYFHFHPIPGFKVPTGLSFTRASFDFFIEIQNGILHLAAEKLFNPHSAIDVHPLIKFLEDVEKIQDLIEIKSVFPALMRSNQTAVLKKFLLTKTPSTGLTSQYEAKLLLALLLHYFTGHLKGDKQAFSLELTRNPTLNSAALRLFKYGRYCRTETELLARLEEKIDPSTPSILAIINPTQFTYFKLVIPSSIADTASTASSALNHANRENVSPAAITLKANEELQTLFKTHFSTFVKPLQIDVNRLLFGPNHNACLEPYTVVFYSPMNEREKLFLLTYIALLSTPLNLNLKDSIKQLLFVYLKSCHKKQNYPLFTITLLNRGCAITYNLFTLTTALGGFNLPDFCQPCDQAMLSYVCTTANHVVFKRIAALVQNDLEKADRPSDNSIEEAEIRRQAAKPLIVTFPALTNCQKYFKHRGYFGFDVTPKSIAEGLTVFSFFEQGFGHLKSAMNQIVVLYAQSIFSNNTSINQKELKDLIQGFQWLEPFATAYFSERIKKLGRCNELFLQKPSQGNGLAIFQHLFYKFVPKSPSETFEYRKTLLSLYFIYLKGDAQAFTVALMQSAFFHSSPITPLAYSTIFTPLEELSTSDKDYNSMPAVIDLMKNAEIEINLNYELYELVIPSAAAVQEAQKIQEIEELPPLEKISEEEAMAVEQESSAASISGEQEVDPLSMRNPSLEAMLYRGLFKSLQPLLNDSATLAFFTDTVMQNQGGWHLPLHPTEKASEKEKQFRARLLAQIVPFLNTQNSLEKKAAAKRVAKDLFCFFRYVPNKHAIPSSVIDCSQFWTPFFHEEKKLSSAQLESVFHAEESTNELIPEREKLSEFSTKESLYSLLVLKKAELKLRAEHYEAIAERAPGQPTKIPCFLIAQDRDRVHVQILSAYFDEHYLLAGFANDSDQSAQEYLQTHLSSSVEIEEVDEDLSCKLSLEQLQELQESLASSTPSGPLPPALIVQRLKPTSTAASENPLAALEPIQEGQKKEKSRSPSPTEEGEQPLKRRRTEKKILQAPEQTTLKLGKEEIDEEESALVERGQKNYRDFSLQGSYQPIDLEPIPSSQKNKEQTGDLPILSTTASLQPLQEQRAAITPLNFWQQINLEALNTISAQVGAAKTKVTALRAEPLNYPLLEKLENLPLSKPFFPLIRTLKNYQSEAVQDLLHYSSQGLSKLLALEMGLGKTYIYGQFLTWMIAHYRSGTQLVILPATLLDPIQDELITLLTEAATTAWQLTGKSPSFSNEMFLEIFDPIVDILTNGQSSNFLVRFLRIYACFPQLPSHLQKSFLKRLLPYKTAFSAALRELVTAHLEKMKDPAMQQRLSSRLAEEKISFNEAMALFDAKKENALEKFDQFPRFMKLAGTILDFDPIRSELPPNGTYSETELSRLRPFLKLASEKIMILNNKKVVEKIRGKNDTGNILLLSLDSVQKYLPDLQTLAIRSLVVDESQNVHTDDIATHNQVAELITALGVQKVREAPEDPVRNNVLLVTGTPIENSLNELWTLLRLANGPLLFNEQNLSALNTLLTKGQKALLQSEKGGLESALLLSFAQFSVLADRILKPMVIQLKMTDEKVKKDWNYKVPERKDVDLSSTLSPAIIQKANYLSKHLGSLQCKIKTASILLHAELENNSLLASWNEQRQKKAFQFLKEALGRQSQKTLEEKKQWIAESPYLNAVVRSEPFKKVVQKKQHFVVVTDRVAIADAFKKAIKVEYGGKEKVRVIKLTGEVKLKDRFNLVQEFKTTKDKPVGIVMTEEVGGTGWNFPEAKKLFLLLNGWNPSKEDQAAARIVRANMEGKKQIVHIRFPELFLDAHLDSIKNKKRLLIQTIWHEGSLKERFDLWCAYVSACCYHSRLNKTKDIENTSSFKTTTLDSALKSLSVTTAQLEEAVAMVSPPRTTKAVPMEISVLESVRKKKEPIQQNYPASACYVLPLPGSGTKERTERLGAYLAKHQHEEEVVEALFEIQTMLDLHARHGIRNLIRSNNSADLNAKKIIQLVQKLEESAQKETISASCEIFTASSDTLSLKESGEQDGEVVVRLVEKTDAEAAKSMETRYDLLFLRDELPSLALERSAVFNLPLPPCSREDAILLGKYLHKNHPDVRHRVDFLAKQIQESEKAGIRGQIRSGKVRDDINLLFQGLFNEAKAQEREPAATVQFYSFFSDGKYHLLSSSEGPPENIVQLRKGKLDNGVSFYEILRAPQ